MLLDRKLFKPFFKKGTYYCQDEICIYYSYKTNRWDMFINGEIIQDKETLSLIKQILTITQELDEKTKIIIFVNDLRLFMSIFPNGKVIGEKTANDFSKHPVYYELKNVQFRNFSLFHISNKGQGITDVCEMVDYLKELANGIGYNTITACRYTAGWIVKRTCSYGKEDKIKQWNYDHKHFMNTVQEYEDMITGCKTGLLKAMSGIHKDVLMIDLSSAYLSKFFHYNKFPIGRNRCYTGIRAIKKLVKNEWFHVVIDEEIEDFSFHCQNGKCGFYYPDVDLYKEQGIDILKVVAEYYKKGVEIRVWDSTEYGSIPEFYLEVPKNMYIRKQRSKGIYKDSAKAVTELFYGKALQTREFNTDSEVYRYFTRPENFVRPEWSMIVNSLVRAQMADMINRLGGSYYHDTDGIETEFTPTNARIVVEENKKIEKFNEEHNLPLQLGTWKIESMHATITIIGRKQRMYIDDEGFLTVKIAGIHKSYIIKHMEENGIKNPIEYFNKQTKITIPNGYFYVKGIGFFESEQKEVLLGKEG